MIYTILYQSGQSKSNLPSLSELLTKSVAELSEEVMTLKLELETERRSCAVLRTGLEQQQVSTCCPCSSVTMKNI